jgi:predicted secreted Zn-dependent protease
MASDPFKGKNTVTAEKGTVSTSNYSITGTTLEEAYKAIQAKGPSIDGKRYAGATDCSLAGFTEGYEYASEEQDDGTFKGYARFNKAKVKYNCAITLPNFSDYKQKLSDEDQKTWATFYAGVVSHENDHVADYAAELGRWAVEIAAMRGEGVNKDEKKAQAAAKADLGGKFKKTFTDAENTKRLKATAKKLDSVSGHGPVLKYTTSSP